VITISHSAGNSISTPRTKNYHVIKNPPCLKSFVASGLLTAEIQCYLSRQQITNAPPAQNITEGLFQNDLCRQTLGFRTKCASILEDVLLSDV